MSVKIQFRCPSCNRGFHAEQDLAGESIKCPRCSTRLTIPAVSDPLAVMPRANSSGLLAPSQGRTADRRVKRRDSDTRPVEMRLPYQLGGMKVDVDQKTSNSLATTFVGGLLVAIGVALAFILGGKRAA